MRKRYIILPIILLMLVSAYQFAFSSSATQIEMFLNGVTDPNTFAPASSGVVYTYSAGTTTNKTVWTDRGKTATAQNPFTLNSMGQAQVYGEGIYKFVIKDAVGGSTLYTYDNISVGTVQGPWTDVSAYASLTAAVTAIGASNKTTLLISGTTTLTANTTVTDNITLLHKSPGLITCGTYTVLINGTFDATFQDRVFDSTCGVGDVVFGPAAVKYMTPELWGGVVGADSTIAMNSAIASSDTPFIKLGMADETTDGYQFNITINKRDVTIVGTGRRSTVVKPYVDAPVITIDSTPPLGYQSFTLKDLELSNYVTYPTSTLFSNDAIYTVGSGISDNHLFERLTIWGFDKGIHWTGRGIRNIFRDIEILFSETDAIAIDADSDTVAFHLNTFDNVLAISSGRHGMYINDTGTIGWLTNSWHNCNFEGSGGDGFHLQGTGGLAGGGGIYDSYFETNTGKNISLASNVLLGFNVTGNLIWASTAGVDYEVSAALAYGTLKSNRMTTAANIAISSQGFIDIGQNYGGTITITPDANGFTHVVTTEKSGDAISRYVGGKTWVDLGSLVEVATAATITTIPDGVLGQKILVSNISGTDVFLTHGTSANNIYTATTSTVTLKNLESIYLYKTSTYWRELPGKLSKNPSRTPTTKSVGASPWSYTNSTGYDELVTISSGTVSNVTFQRREAGRYPSGAQLICRY
jgi:hypothetical protein